MIVNPVRQFGDEVFGLYGADDEVVSQPEVYAAPTVAAKALEEAAPLELVGVSPADAWTAPTSICA